MSGDTFFVLVVGVGLVLYIGKGAFNVFLDSLPLSPEPGVIPDKPTGIAPPIDDSVKVDPNEVRYTIVPNKDGTYDLRKSYPNSKNDSRFFGVVIEKNVTQAEAQSFVDNLSRPTLTINP